jgi:2-polyprenyl-6-methoxyphenol hydroxylase-like FAD-dependent oxidoreductase
MTQVVIVGAGPTGATLALLLVKRGIPVKLIEASRDFRRVFRGEGLMPSGLDALEQMGLSDLLEGIPHKALDAWEFIIEERSLMRVKEPIEAGGKPCTLVSQPHLLEALIAEASQYHWTLDKKEAGSRILPANLSPINLEAEKSSKLRG